MKFVWTNENEELYSRTINIGQKVRGLHWKGKRPDYVILSMYELETILSQYSGLKYIDMIKSATKTGTIELKE